METPTYIALSRQTTLLRELEVVANNIANVTTSGYKAERMLFAEFVRQAGAGEEMSMVQDIAAYRDTSDGPLVRTDNEFDFAINGSGYFVVGTPLGERYTRNGGFTLDDSGRLVTPQAYEVMGVSGPISVPVGDSEIMVATDGTISSRESGELGKLRVVRFANEQQLRKVANGLYASDLPPETPPDGEVKVVQGAVESSNVNPVSEIARMIVLQRSFEASQRMVEMEHRRQRDAINRVFQPLGS